MHKEWHTSQLSEIADVVMGQSPSGSTCGNDSRQGMPLLNGPTEFGANHPVPVQFTTDPKKMSETDDLLFCVRGSTTGRMNWGDQNYAIGRGIAAIRHKKGKEYQPFLKGLIENSLPELIVSATGSTFPNVSRNQLLRLEIDLPPLQEQHAIAHILGSLDNKIELSRRMNETLEAMASAIFKSWFVDFDPVRAKAEGRDIGLSDEIAKLFPDSFEGSVIGEIPRGWEVMPLPRLIDMNPKRALKKGQVAPYLEMKNMPEHSARALYWYNRKYGSGVKYINGDTLFARITPCLENGKGAFVDFLEDGQVGWGSTEYIVFRAKKPLPLEYSYFLSRTSDFRSCAIINMTGSSGRQRVPASIFESFLVIKPDEQVAQLFGALSGPVMQKIKKNDEETRSLVALRDSFLPKLISGELRVPDAEKFLEGAG